jgi:uncharacterized damage-inducible protein DinB
MNDLKVIAELFLHNDQANGIVLDAARGLSDAQLDRAFEMGRGTLRKTILHTWAGEHVWLERWRGRVEATWPNEEEQVSVAELASRMNKVARERDEFLAGVTPEKLAAGQRYRDSKGTLFDTTLRDMILQMFVHSSHHRAQAVNMLRHLGVNHPQVDYMMMVRKAV